MMSKQEYFRTQADYLMGLCVDHTTAAHDERANYARIALHELEQEAGRYNIQLFAPAPAAARAPAPPPAVRPSVAEQARRAPLGVILLRS